VPPPPRTRPPAPLMEPEPYEDYEPEPEPKKNRGLAIAAAVLAVMLVSGVAYAIISNNRGDDSSANPGTSTPKTSSQTQDPSPTKTSTPATTTQKPTQSQTYQSPPPSSKPAGSKFTTAQVTQFVKQHYGKLPQNLDAARADWDPDQAPSPSTDKEYWGNYTKVAIKGTPLVKANGDSFTVTTALQLTEAETDKTTTAEHTLTISGKGEQLQITGEEKG